MIGNLNIWAMISLEITEKNNVFNKYVTNTRDSITFSQFSNWSEELVKVLEKSRNKYFMNLSNKSTDPRAHNPIHRSLDSNQIIPVYNAVFLSDKKTRFWKPFKPGKIS